MAKIDKFELAHKALTLRHLLGEDAYSPIDIFAMVQQMDNITLIMHPMSEHMSGYCRKCPYTNIIVINSAMTIGRQRYSLAHELYHVYFDDGMKSFVCTNFTSKELNEQKADLFASYFLMPQTALDNIKVPITINDIVKLEQYYKVSRKALLYRLLSEKKINTDELELFSRNVKQSARLAGFNEALYNPLPENERYYVYGKYIINAEKMLNENKISYGKYEEYLLTAYREDIVYGTSDGGEIID
ncbi:ImmA/IrrE family metallo-endopeptidase [Eubacterium oxidoreducens]|uniref:IrrE N-terminal-like domain-containing protein n=1 Tax=Eubacterium oxidoreducens TaxID=1732 RepID=A0A1G6C3M3_EUBOX|nr:ImmA/IrrE family metallo-endopeptidase [Eubacterium oxidoreducens]SDB27418.1 protein of unknown function [Eubacterium oxidoreducens]